MTTAPAIEPTRIGDDPFPPEPKPVTVQEMMDFIFGEPTPTWALTDYADCFVYLRRAWKLGWRFRRFRNAAVQVHKPNGGGWHVLTARSCSDCYKYAKDGTCSHSSLIRQAGGIELCWRVLGNFDFSKPFVTNISRFAEQGE